MDATNTPFKWSLSTIALMVVILLALTVRIWGVWFGLPYIFHNDEGLEVIRALRLGAGEFDFDRIGKGGYFYVLFVEYGVLFVVLKVFGVVSTANEFADYFIRDPSAFYLIGRATTAIIGTINVYLVYRIGCACYSYGAGIIGAALFSVNILHADLSHFITVDVPMTCLATACLLFAVRIVQNGRRSDYFWTAVLAASATATKIPAALLIIPILVAHGYRLSERSISLRRFFADRIFWQSIVLFLAIYVALSPGIVVNFGAFVGSLFGKFGIGPDLLNAGTTEIVESDAGSSRFGFYTLKLWEGMSGPVFLLCVAGAGYGLWRRQNVDVLLLSFATAVYLAMSLSMDSREFFPRYILPMMPVMAVLGGRLLIAMLDKLSPNRVGMAATAATIALSLLPLASIVASNYEMTQPDTRALAKEWVDATIPDGAKVFIEGSTAGPSNSTVPLKNSRENLARIIEDFADSEPGKARYFRSEMRTLTGSTYDLMLIRDLESNGLDYFKEAGVQYFVLRPDNYAGLRRQEDWPELVEAIRRDPEIELVQRFQPEPNKTPGPLIEIYRVNANVPDPEY